MAGGIGIWKQTQQWEAKFFFFVLFCYCCFLSTYFPCQHFHHLQDPPAKVPFIFWHVFLESINQQIADANKYCNVFNLLLYSQVYNVIIVKLPTEYCSLMFFSLRVKVPIEKIAYYVKLCDLSLIVVILVDKPLFLVSVIFLLLYFLPSIALTSME